MNGFDTKAPLLPEIFALHGKWRSRQDALICGDKRLNWAEFCALNHQLANGLVLAGIKPGDRIGIVMSNCAEMVQALFACMAAGAVSVPINLSVSNESIGSMLSDAKVSSVFTTADQQARLKNVLPDTLKLMVTTGAAGNGWQNIEALCAGQDVGLPRLSLTPDDYLNIIYSSGTTGNPKGIVHTHAGRRDWAYDLAIALRYNCSARTLINLGLYSNISWVAMLCTMLSGGALIIHQRFEADAFLRAVEQEKITHTAMVPIQFQRVVEAMDVSSCDVSSMLSMMSCGSPLHESLKKSIFSRFSCGVIELYGLTEGIITTLEPEEAEGRWSSVGKPLIGTDIAIVDEDNSVLPPGQAGEIVSRGRITMPGYLNREEANRDAEFVDSQGVQWLRSGDVGVVDEEGYLYIVDRKKDMIISGGQNIYPQDIEAVLVGHDSIDDVAVIGLKSKRWSETPVALVVSVAGAEITEVGLLEWANTRLGKQQRLSGVIFIDELPRNPNGKILKREMRELHKERVYE